MPSTSQLALDVMCGEWGASRCSAKKWFEFMGTPDGNPYVPFKINYVGRPDTKPFDGMIPHDPLVVPCNESINVSNQTI